jgi:pimeloyl-ACP methyl ester carboxylesterase
MFISPLPERRKLAGAELELLIKGDGQPLLFLHAGHGVDAGDPLIEMLSKSYKVIAPSHPGFGASPRPDGVDTVDDLAYVYLDLLEELDLTDVIVVGVSFGGWIAAELVTKGSDRIAQLVLINAVGVKFGDRETRDIYDIFGTTIEQIPGLFFADEGKGLNILGDLNFKDMDQASVLRFAQNRESLLLFGWSPTLYNPKLKDRLRRVKVPTLVLWGKDDQVAPPSYGRKYAEAIAGATYDEIGRAGHYGYLEQPQAFADKITTFLRN